ncbi:hypothetical protein [Psychromonas hadalis]|uniref:hypothetical protein n=1 Tax=Psychromonas hadalis TaxID=211669 RepID=UPI0003B380CC|nr:hypothetical protein [Psychromonas hadalis]
MATLTNVELNANLYNPVVFFDLDGTTYAIFTDGPERVLTGDMDDICEELSSQMKMNKNCDNETTTFKFDDFHIVSSGGSAIGMLN